MKVLKACLLWLLLLAIPMQGMAVSAMLICKASHQRVAHNASHQAMSMQHASGVQHDHAHHADQHDMLPVQDLNIEQTVTESAPASHLHNHDLSTCSACAACCIGSAWIPAQNLRVPPLPPVVSGDISYFAFHIPGVVPERPEHPPRLFLS